MSIVDTLIEISNESLLNHAEKISLSLIAKEVESKDERIKELEQAVKEWRNKADSELRINADLHTETAHLQERIKELEAALRSVCSRCRHLETVMQALKGGD